MIYPTIYSFNAPYRGPKQGKEIQKLFTSIIYDISIANSKLNQMSDDIKEDFMGFYEGGLLTKPTESIEIDGNNISFQGINSMHRKLNEIESQMNQMLYNL